MKKFKKQTKKYWKKLSKKTSKRLRIFHRKKSRTKYILIVMIAAIIFLVVSINLLNGNNTTNGRLVTFHDRGQNHVILTRAKTVNDALYDARITVSPQDIVEPTLGSELLTSDSAVIINRARPVLIIDGSLRQKVVTAAQSPNEIATAAGIATIADNDKTSIKEASVIGDGATETLTIARSTPIVVIPEKKPTAQTLTISKGAQIFVDSSGVAHRETYYDLPMNIVIGACGGSDYTIRYDGAKIDKDGYVLVAASYAAYPRCTVVETSMGPGKVYDTGGFVLRYPHGFDLATDWTNYNGR